MKRRKALKKIGLGLSLGCVGPQLLTSCVDPEPSPVISYDGSVVVIGAGAAGLYTASILHSKGIKVSILEASSRLGGRVSSFDDFSETRFISPLPIELGASVIYGSDSVLGLNLTRAGVPLIELEKDFISQFVIGDQVKSGPDWAGNADFSAAQDFVANLPSYSGSSGTVSQAIAGLSASAQALLSAQIGNLYGSSNDLIGIQQLAKNLSARKHDNKLLMLQGNLLDRFLSSRFYTNSYPIQFNAPVTSINYANGSTPIGITYGGGEQITADKVVVTVPISILKNNDMSFSPGLPADKVSAMGRIGMDSSIRVVLEFKENFWGASSNFIWGLDSAPHCFSSGVGRGEESTILSITINGPKAMQLSLLGQNLVTQILADLDAIYDGKATRNVRRDLNSNQIISIIKDWGKDQYIKGGYSYPLTSASMDDYALIGKAVQDKLFFAGEATDVLGYAGTVNGALNSAERVSEEVITSIQGANP